MKTDSVLAILVRSLVAVIAAFFAGLGVALVISDGSASDVVRAYLNRWPYFAVAFVVVLISLLVGQIIQKRSNS